MSALPWWKTAVFYQIYPRSFADANQDGIGDIPGIIEKLDYLQDLGVDAIWLSPHFPSPQFDCGYDIADYTGVAPEYGTLEDFKRMLDEMHRRGMRLILDLVLNHTSDQHPWFIESRSSRNNPKRDWYIWRDGKNGGPPNNWHSCFDGPAWEYDPATEQYFYHFFFKQQPDLNWRNPQVKQAMFDAVRFWLELGVDGYRLDAIGTIYEPVDLPDHSVPLTLAELRKLGDTAMTPEEHAKAGALWEEAFRMQVGQPGLHELMKELRQVVNEYPDRMLVAEDEDIRYMGNGEDEIDLVFNFPLMRTHELRPEHIRANQRQRLAELAAVSPTAWACNTLGNHDSSRLLTRFGIDTFYDVPRALLGLATVLTLKGTPFLYNGEELGMSDYLLEDIESFRDQLGIWYYHAQINDLGRSPAEALSKAARLTRDKNRTPMPWSNAPNGGFCPAHVRPWLPMNPSWADGQNVADHLSGPDSMLQTYKRLLAVRRAAPALQSGDYLPMHQDSKYYLAFLRRTPQQTCLVVLNFSPSWPTLDFSPELTTGLVLYASDGQQGRLDLSRLAVESFGIYILECQPS